MARKVVEEYTPGVSCTKWSYARWKYLHFRRDWDKHYDNIMKALVYVCRYTKQPLNQVMQLEEIDLWRLVKYTSDAIKKENPKSKG